MNTIKLDNPVLITFKQGKFTDKTVVTEYGVDENDKLYYVVDDVHISEDAILDITPYTTDEEHHTFIERLKNMFGNFVKVMGVDGEYHTINEY